MLSRKEICDARSRLLVACLTSEVPMARKGRRATKRSSTSRSHFTSRSCSLALPKRLGRSCSILHVADFNASEADLCDMLASTFRPSTGRALNLRATGASCQSVLSVSQSSRGRLRRWPDRDPGAFMRTMERQKRIAGQLADHCHNLSAQVPACRYACIDDGPRLPSYGVACGYLGRSSGLATRHTPQYYSSGLPDITCSGEFARFLIFVTKMRAVQ